MKVLSFEYNNDGVIETIDNDLEGLQGVVGGNISIIPLIHRSLPQTEQYYLVCNEDGIMEHLYYQRKYAMYGKFFICKYGGKGELAGLTDTECECIKSDICNILTRVLRDELSPMEATLWNEEWEV